MIDAHWPSSYSAAMQNGLDDIERGNLQARIDRDTERSDKASVDKGQINFRAPVKQLSPMEMSA